MNAKQKRAIRWFFVDTAKFELDDEGNAIFYDSPNAAGFHRKWRIARNGDVYLEVSDDYGWYEEDLVNPAA